MSAVKTFVDVINLACGHRGYEDVGAGRRTQLILASMFGALLLSAIWGAAAGSISAPLAAGNLLKVPLVVFLACLCALPAGVVAVKLAGLKLRPSDLILSYSSGVFAGGLVLAVLAPLVAVYYHTSAWAGATWAQGSAFVAIVVGGLIFFRNLYRRGADEVSKPLLVLTALVFLGVYLAALLQLVALASPILPEPSAFEGGIDTLMGH